jgi:hypothetical protein
LADGDGVLASVCADPMTVSASSYECWTAY